MVVFIDLQQYPFLGGGGLVSKKDLSWRRAETENIMLF